MLANHICDLWLLFHSTISSHADDMLKSSQTCIASSDILCSKSAPSQVTPAGDYLHLPRLWTEQYLPLLVGSYRRPSSPIGRAILAGGRASTTCCHYLLLSLLSLHTSIASSISYAREASILCSDYCTTASARGSMSSGQGPFSRSGHRAYPAT